MFSYFVRAVDLSPHSEFRTLGSLSGLVQTPRAREAPLRLASSPLGTGVWVWGSAQVLLGVRQLHGTQGCLLGGIQVPESEQPALQDENQFTVSAPWCPPFSCSQHTGCHIVFSLPHLRLFGNVTSGH